VPVDSTATLAAPSSRDCSPNRFFQARVDEFVSRVQEKALAYQGDDIMLPMGSDFMYQDAPRW
jgi:hypothetical protein